jgi:hypothetical protein
MFIISEVKKIGCVVLSEYSSGSERVKGLKLSDYSGLLFDLVICLSWHATLSITVNQFGMSLYVYAS